MNRPGMTSMKAGAFNVSEGQPFKLVLGNSVGQLRKLSCEKDRVHPVMHIVRRRVEVLKGFAQPVSQANAARQFLPHLARDCLFGRFIRLAAAAGQKVVLSLFD